MLRLNVEGMHCGGCARSVTKVVHTVDALAQVRIDLGARTLEAETSVDPGLFVKAIRDAGYAVSTL